MAAQRASSSRCMSLSYSASRACSVTCREEERRGEGKEKGGKERGCVERERREERGSVGKEEEGKKK